MPNGPSERLREAQKSSYNHSLKTDRFCYQTYKQLLHFVVRSVPVHFGSLPSSSDVSLPHSFLSIWIDRRRARAHLRVSETRLDRQASSESSFQHSGNAFGSTGAERERSEQKSFWAIRSVKLLARQNKYFLLGLPPVHAPPPRTPPLALL